jgi:hypothetical protein
MMVKSLNPKVFAPNHGKFRFPILRLNPGLLSSNLTFPWLNMANYKVSLHQYGVLIREK